MKKEANERVAEKRRLLDEIARFQQRLQSQSDVKGVPVEFRELRHPNKEQAQGIAEMWVEVLT